MTDLPRETSRWGVAMRRISIPLLSASVAAAVASIVLLGWLFHAYALTRILPSLPVMAVPTAIGFLLSSLALALSASRTAESTVTRRLVVFLPAIAVVLLGLGTFGYYFLSGSVNAPTVESGVPINRTSPNTAVNFILLGLGLLLLDRPLPQRGGGGAGAAESPIHERWAYQILALVVVLDAILALLGQVFGVMLLYGISRAIAMALPTALLFLVLGVGVLAARPERGFVAILLSGNAAGNAARRLLPVVIAIPFVLGSITLFGIRLTASVQTYLLVVADIALLASLFWSMILALQKEVEQALSYARQVADQALALEQQKAEIERGAMLVQQRRFVREMLSSVTEGKLRLCEDPTDLSQPLNAVSEPIVLRAETLRVLRRCVMKVAEELQLSGERAHDLVTAVGEAGMNAVRHGGGGIGRVHSDPDRGIIQVWIQDHGTGIRHEDLHRATLEKGWSGAGSFGHGFYLMLRTADRTYLLTGAQGTTVVLEQEANPPRSEWFPATGG